MQFTTFALAALSLGSAIAGPIASPLAGFAGFDDAVAAVTKVQSIVEEQANTINVLVKSAPSTETITKIQQSLVNVGTNINALHNVGINLGNFDAVKTPLSKEQKAAVPDFASNFQGIFVTVQSISKTVTAGGLPQGVVAQVQPQLQLVLSTAAPVTKPVILFVTNAVPGGSTLVAPLTGLVGNLSAVLGGLGLGL
ncbi:hypothetical protein F4777DRAFT_579445 [Nemania sp. FL0916]|nr:hypothetical protein F4777DRAFT_579445 [Nemania sp. FL0916]